MSVFLNGCEQVWKYQTTCFKEIVNNYAISAKNIAQ